MTQRVYIETTIPSFYYVGSTMDERDEPKDGAIERVREARMRISEEFGHDPKRLVEHYMELQKQYTDRLVKSDSNGEDEKRA